MKHIEYILLSIVNWILMAIKVVERASLWLKEQTEQQAEHQRVQLLIVIDGSLRSLLLVKIIL